MKNWNRGARRARGIIRTAAATIAVAVVVSIASPALANSGSATATSPENAWYYGNVLRSNANAQNNIQYQWNGNDAGGGGVMFRITTASNTTLGEVDWPGVGAWTTMYDSYAGHQWFPSGGFYTAIYPSAACGGSPCNGNGLITAYGNLNWNLPY